MKRNTYTKPVCDVVKMSTTPLLAAVSAQSLKIGDPYHPDSDSEEDAPYELTDADDKSKWWIAE